MKLNKKILLKTAFAPLALATPIVLVNSCGIKQKTCKVIKPSVQKADWESANKIDKYSSKPYPKTAIMNVYNSISNTMNFTKELKGELKLQGVKVLDTSIIAFIGYLRENAAINLNANGLSEENKKKRDEKIKLSKMHFSENLKKMKIQVDILFDKLATGDDKTLLSSLIRKTTSKTKKIGLNFKKESPMVNVSKLISKKIKVVMDNVLDTLINIENPAKPSWKTNSNVKKIGSLKQIISLDNIPSIFNGNEIKKQVISFLNGELISGAQKDIKRSFKSSYVDLFDYIQASDILKGIGKSFIDLKSIDQPENSIENNGFQAGLKMFKKISQEYPERIMVYQDLKTKNIYFEIDGKTSEFISELKKNIKYTNKTFGGLINDPFLNNIIISPLMKNGEITLPSQDKIMEILKNPSRISGFLNKIDGLLSDFGKTMQFTEMNLQSFISNLSGDNVQYYGEINFDKKLNSYKMQKNYFISPQFNIFKYSNYLSNNEKIKLAIKNHQTKNPHLRKTIDAKIKNIQLDIPIIGLVDKLTKDPYSNYTISLVELVNALKLEDINA
ncbi:hypothetical protein MYMA111404_02450 [Mycoplasma marinum]|uniref:Lipoprotein n=1 Tax=Mycoplasma marinum TaxID=1937190 RepID=A0A4R0XST8_9MOLU|nr:hypothetical protein [Mycoplasma marinum]TCG10669.1 hypothetical protein C4B24_04260 [Mycoplasma marinum]